MYYKKGIITIRYVYSEQAQLQSIISAIKKQFIWLDSWKASAGHTINVWDIDYGRWSPSSIRRETQTRPFNLNYQLKIIKYNYIPNYLSW